MSSSENTKPRFKSLQEFEADIPWAKLNDLIGSYFIAAKICRLLVPTETMLRIYFLQKRYGMSASAVEEALFEVQVIRNFAQIDLQTDIIPNDSCLVAFQKLIKDQSLEQTLDDAFNITPLID